MKDFLKDTWYSFGYSYYWSAALSRMYIFLCSLSPTEITTCICFVFRNKMYLEILHKDIVRFKNDFDYL